ncbi:MAG TPA: Na(+)/H(+) antiporter subunit B [Xanthomonadaceae bacterium]|nr:Na(+)/H(+) antiporter subunit B [Xanthomonadaceae bacterium]
MSDNTILRVVCKFLIPYILLFALYVQFHGDYGPGGGFQAGVIFAAAFIIHTLIFGVGNTAKVVPPPFLRGVAAGGVLLYAGTGVASMLLGADFLDYDALAADPIAGQHLGILLVEFGVGLTVASTMMLIFFAFAERGEPE